MPDSGITTSPSIDPRSGFCSSTRIFHSVRPQFPLPDDDMSVARYVFSLLEPELSTAAVREAGVVDALTGECVSYSEVMRRAEGLAAVLWRRIGLRRGHVAFVLLGNTVEVPVVYLALMLIGVVVSPANPVSTVNEIDRQLELCKPVIAFATRFTASKVSKLKFGTVLVDSPEFKAMMAEDSGGVEECDSVRVSQSDPAMLLYSSGTTGRVKGVVLTHKNYIAALAGGRAAVTPARDTPVVMFCSVPYFHVYGLIVLLGSVASGRSLVSMERVDVEVVMRAIERYKVTHLAAAPPLVMSLVKKGEEGIQYDLSSLEMVGSGGAPLREAVIKKFQTIFPSVQLLQAYGLTETTGGFTRAVGLEERANGRLIPHSQAKIVDPETGEALPPMKVGEIWFRGPTVMKGYVGDEKAVVATFDPEGWLKTGDLGYFDEEGFLFFSDRMKELIKYNAYQVAPAELEDILLSHPEIVEAAVIPYPDEKAGEVPMAFIVREPSSKLNESEVKKFVANQVAPYKRVRLVSFVDSIPKNTTGKVLRKELIKLALSPTMSKL
uniref:4-coumarate--CoA ligase n=1 Tax=Kalanchoe fedtschenkoi TaxID=63787 RepID=A0A7N0VJG9_KALFE